MNEINYKVLIADDEYWTREKIRNMIVWEDYHLTFLEPAQNGEEVLERLAQEKADILITDINMPFMDGVELVKKVKEIYPEIVVFVVSGYDNFDYVKQTLLAGAINYLLKPLTKIDLVNSLSKALEIISREEENKQQILKTSSLIQDTELSFLLSKEENMVSPVITMNQVMDFAGYSLLLIKIHNLKKAMETYGYDRNLLSYFLKKEIKESAGCENILLFNNIYHSNEFIIITQADNAQLKKMTVKILNRMNELLKSPLSIMVSEHSYSLDSIHEAYTQCISILMTRKYKKESIILFHEKENEAIHQELKNVLSEENEHKIKNMLRNNNMEGLRKEIFENIGIKTPLVQEWEYIKMKQCVKKICNIIMDFMMEKNAPKEMIALENMADSMDRTVEYLEQEEVCNSLEEMLRLLIGNGKEIVTGSIRDMVRQAIGYIDEHFFEELTLSLLAEKFAVESSYFSKIFRQETGENVMLYIAGKRMAKAKEYMKDEHINLTEIAFMVGYDDYTYFNRVFRKMEGMSPRDYRKEN